MRAGHSSHKESLNRINIVSTAECECGDGLQMEEHIFWDWTVRGAASNNEGYSVWERQEKSTQSQLQSS
jgi:hypothetical protein